MRSPLAGIGQIYFQSSPLFGLLLLGCLYLSAPALAAGCLLGVCAASGTAWTLDYPQAEREAGQYGFNGALSGVGLCAAWQFNVALLCWIALAGMATALLTRAMTRWGWPPLTFLFVLVMWLSTAAGPALGLTSRMSEVGAGCGMASPGYAFCVIGQASFVGAAAPGLLLWLALARGRKHLGAWGLAGGGLAWAVLSLASLALPAAPVAAVATAAGANSALTALGLSVHERHWRWRCLGAVTSIGLCACFAALGLDFYTLPFVLSVWLVLAVTAQNDVA
ncbi:urea transporter [Rugamonas apoptosis]|uniref:Urea transporter n=1 Tax=Rugamonas apoptosis TaxID=2758570 RepID=A0A7W2F901_9BURK|nr:urea transporter [Rugamonas apoptosis]MBA5687371.1 urea transporter [Rugamonas apoptosis]